MTKRLTYKQVRDAAFANGYRQGWYAHRSNDAKVRGVALACEEGEPVFHFGPQDTPDQIDARLGVKP